MNRRQRHFARLAAFRFWCAIGVSLPILFLWLEWSLGGRPGNRERAHDPERAIADRIARRFV